MKSHMSRFLSLVLVLILGILSCTPALAADKTEFSDVPTTHWAYDAIQECATGGIVTGFADGTFRPDENVTGIQFIVMLTRTFYCDEVAAVTTPAGQPWYYPNMEAAKNLQLTYRVESINDQPMSRYDMAEVLYNVSDEKDIPVDPYEFPDADMLKDFDDILGENHYNAVMSCYYFGVLTGMSDGTFSGFQNMTRAQACTVITRMMKLLNKYNPGDKDNDQYDDGTSQNQGGNSKLTNGKDATVANVVAMLEEIERKYPAGTIWGPAGTANNNWYVAPATTKTRDVIANNSKIWGGKLSMGYACGGWACMVSETIFGLDGAPCREVYNFKDARPGDIVYKINASTGQPVHVSIVTTVNLVNNKWLAATCDGNSAGKVAWNWDKETGLGNWGMQSSNGTYTYRIFTRYPEGLEELPE